MKILIQDFEFKDFYDFILKNHTNFYTFAEIGCYKGVSISYLSSGMRERNNHQPNVYDYYAIYAIDTWSDVCPQTNSLIYDSYISNIKEKEVYDSIIDIRKSPLDASKMFDDRYFDFIFVNFDIISESFRNILHYWFPKVQKGGIISGNHIGNITNDSVVYEYTSELKTMKSVWYFYKK